MSDSAAPPSDTAPALRASATAAPTAATDTPPKPAPTPSLPKPNIDPGRKPRAQPADAGKSAQPAPDSTKTSAAAPNQAPKYDAGTNTVTFDLIAGPFNFNGFTSGGGTLTLPPKANVVINFVNKDGTPHSAEVVSGEGPIPNAATDPAIPRAYTNKVLEGLPQEASDVMKFTVPESGTYRIFCGVPGHGLSGMWIWMKVDSSAKTPSFGPTKA